MVRFVRVTYVRRGADDSTDTPSTTDYWPPKGFSYKTFVPSPVKVAMCSGAPVYESFASTWERARVWLRLVGQSTPGRLDYSCPLYSIMSIGHGADPGFLAVSPQVTLVINPVLYRLPLLFTRPAVTFPAKQITSLAGTKLYCLVTEAHMCK